MSLNYPDPGVRFPDPLEEQDRDAFLPYDPTRLTNLSLGDVHDKAAARAGKTTEEVTAADVADYMLAEGATQEQLAQIFDPESAQKISAAFPSLGQRGLDYTETEQEVSDYVLEEEASGLEVPEFAKRFQQAAGIGMGRAAELRQLGGIPASQAAFPVAPPTEPPKLPRKTRAELFFDSMGTVFSDVGSAANDILLSGMGENFDAPAMTQEADEARKYVGDFVTKEIEKASQVSSVIGKALRFLGVGLGASGRVAESYTSEMRFLFGKFMAIQILHGIGQDKPGHWSFVPDPIPIHVRNPEVYADAMDPTRLQAIVDSDDPQDAQDFWDINTREWPTGVEGLVSGNLRWVVEMALFPTLPGMNILSRGVGTALKAPFKFMSRPLKAGINKVDKRILADWHWEAISRTADERVKVFAHELETSVQGFLDAAEAGNDPVKISNVLKDLTNLTLNERDWQRMMQTKYYSKNPALQNKRILDTLDSMRGSPNVNRLQAHVKDQRLDLLQNGVKANKRTLKAYGSVNERPPLPFNVSLELAEEVMKEGWEASPTAIIDGFVRRTLVEYAESLGWDGPRVWLPVIKGGNVNPIRYLSMVAKSQLGSLWLLMRPGFVVLNLVGGMVTVSQHQGLNMLRYPTAAGWINKAMKAGVDERMILGEKAIAGSKGQAGIIGNVLGQTEELIDDAALGGRSIGRGDVPGPLPAKIPIVGEQIIPFIGKGTVKLRDVKIPKTDIELKFGSAMEHLTGSPEFNINTGLMGFIKGAVGVTESAQHRGIQKIIFEQTAKRVFADNIMALDMPDVMKHQLINSFNRGDDWIFQPAVVDAWWLRRLAETQTGKVIDPAARKIKPDIRPDDIMSPFSNPQTERIVRKHLSNLPDGARGSQIEDVMEKAVTEIEGETDKAIERFYEVYPGQPGHQAYDLLKQFRDAGGKVNARTYDTLGRYLKHEEDVRILQTKVLDAVSERMTPGLDEQAQGAIQVVLKRVEREFDEIRVHKGKRITQITADYSRDKKNTFAAAGEEYRKQHDRLMYEVLHKYKEISDKLLGDEMVMIWNAAIDRGMKSQGKTPPSFGRVVMDQLNEGMTQINQSIRKVRVESKNELPEIRSEWMAHAQSKRMQDIQALYSRVSSKHGISLEPVGEKRLVIGEETFVQIIRMVDQEFGNTTLTEALLDDSINSLLRRGSQREVEKVRGSIEGTVARAVFPHKASAPIEDMITRTRSVQNRAAHELNYGWGNTASELAEQVPVTSTSDDVTRSVRSAFTKGRLTGEEGSAETLFAYQYNRAEVALQTIMPYPYWSMKFFMFQMRRAVHNPGQFIALGRIMSAWYEMDRDLPLHLRGTMRIVTLPDGTEVRLDPKQFLSGGYGTPMFEIISWGEEGEDSEFGFNLKSLFQVTEMIGLSQVYPHISMAIQGLRHAIGDDNIRNTLPTEVNDALFGFQGIIPGIDETLNGLGGSLQGIVKSRAGQGSFGEGVSEWVSQHGLTEGNMIGTSKVLAEMFKNGEIGEFDAMQAMIDVREGNENPIALQATQRYFSKRSDYREINFNFGGVRSYPAIDKERNEAQRAYFDLIDSGRVDEAKEFLASKPWLPVSWITRKDTAEIKRRLNVGRYFFEVDALVAAAQAQKEGTDVITGLRVRNEIDETLRQNKQNLQKQFKLSDEDIGITDDVRMRGPETGPPMFPGGREAAMKHIVGAYFDMNKAEDYETVHEIRGQVVNVLEQDGLERFIQNRELWIEEHVSESMLPLFEAQLSKNITLPDAILRVFSKVFAREFFIQTKDMAPDEKDSWLERNNLPSPLSIMREVQSAFPDRWDQDAIMSKIGSTLSIRGYLDVTQQEKINRVRRGSNENPYSFQTSSGRIVTRENVNDFEDARDDLKLYLDDKPMRTLVNNGIETAVRDYRSEMSQLRPMDFAANNDDPIREKYYGSEKKGTKGLIGLLLNEKKVFIAQGKIAPWTDRAQEWFGKADVDQSGNSEALSAMRDMYNSVNKSSFIDDENGPDWDAFFKAQETAFDEAVEFGRGFDITEEMFRADLYKNLTASEAAWRYWQKAVIQPIMAKRSAIKAEQNGLITRPQHNALAATSPPTTLVRHVMGEILMQFPHLNAWDVTLISQADLPSFSEYWAARGYAPPKPSSSRSTSTSTGQRRLPSGAAGIIAASVAGGGADWAPPTR